MKKFLKKLKSIDYRHYIALGITLSFVLITLFVFPKAFTRIGESLRDFWNSCVYYFKELLSIKVNVVPSVVAKSEVGFTPLFGLPSTWEDFQLVWAKYWELWATEANFVEYLNNVAVVMLDVSRVILMLVVPLILVLYILFERYISTHNNDYDKDSKALTRAKWFGEKVWIPVKRWVASFITFLIESKYIKLWAITWAFNFNFITIFIEFLAFYFYFVVSFDIANLYIQAYKLLSDLSVIVAFMPPIAWVIIGYLILCAIRKRIGYNVLNHNERKNCGFINERPIVYMVCGTMGKGKTTVITDMALSQEVMLRDKALELLIKNDLKFPYFPWIKLENVLKKAIYKHEIYNLATTRKFIRHLRFFFDNQTEDKKLKACFRRRYVKYTGVFYDNYLFGYDYEKYGVFHDDKLKLEYVWDIIETYAQLYFIYIIQSSLIISNYSVRTDGIVSDLGNLPMRDNDFFKRDSKIIDDISRHAHIIDFNAMRLGKNLGEEPDIKRDSFEFGVVNITEVGKERKNNLQLQEMKRKDDVANQKNDGFNDWLKMIRHSATVDNFPFVKVITDEQRPESWGADARDLCEIVTLEEKCDLKLTMPFFFVEELLYNFVFSKFMSLYTQYRYVRADNTLFMWIVKKLTSILNDYYTGIYNTFGNIRIKTQLENGTQDGTVTKKNYNISVKKTYSKRFSTDCFSDYFAIKGLRSKIGLEDLEEYFTEKATFEELNKQKSYFIEDLTKKSI